MLVFVTDRHLNARQTPKAEGYVPDSLLPGWAWLSGKLSERPVGASRSTVFQAQDTGETYMWLDDKYSVGPLQKRPRVMRPGACYLATDTGQLFCWED